MQPTILIITGEESGDLYAKKLVQEIKKLSPGVNFYGIVGKELEEEVKLLFSREKLTVVGFSEVVEKVLHFREAMKRVKKFIKKHKPKVCILIDFPGFNLKIAKLAHTLGVKVIYYSLPQLWAWGKWRIIFLKKWVDECFCILPFEEEFYKKLTLPVKFVGHPITEMIEEKELPVAKDTILLLPGSRLTEFTYTLPIFFKCIEKLPNFKFIIKIPPPLLPYLSLPSHLTSRTQITSSPLSAFSFKPSFAIVTSGTVVLEVALLGIPMVIVYKVSNLSYFLAKFLVKTKYIGLVNLIFNKPLVPELIQSKFTFTNLLQLIKTKTHSSPPVEFKILSHKLKKKEKPSQIVAKEVVKYF